MSTTSVPLIRHARPRPAAKSLQTLFRSMPATLAFWRERSRQRRRLVQLDDRLLKDIGLTRGQVLYETSKWFWQD